jgi:hypothetical protein
MDYKKIKLRSVVVNGREAEGLDNAQVKTKVLENELQVNLSMHASVLEICTLSELIGVLLDVQYFVENAIVVGERGPSYEYGYRSFKLVLKP